MPNAVARTRYTNAPDNHHLHFLEIQKAKQIEKAAKPAPLSVEQHAANRKHLSVVRFVKPKYSSETEINVSGIFGRWKRYAKIGYKLVLEPTANLGAATAMR